MSCIDRSKVNTPSGFPGRKVMSSARHGQGSGKMSSAHGVTTKGATKGMVHASGRVGAGHKGFGSGNFKQGPCPIGDSSKKSSNSYHPKKGGRY